ncbi:hypothetical protein SAMN04489796_10713 [Winogradskyella thalassocola]|uniref:Uncharacterized protein n=1 Tax=Winogradskyella thalassocola TaxID=262004 RepID=A0A1G8HQ24_9FLAO|nr:hypothetical protein SAMN04489796_10713 [Winogradskyella thalassocola]
MITKGNTLNKKAENIYINLDHLKSGDYFIKIVLNSNVVKSIKIKKS